jgi:N-acetylmuramic acid 6-phosphate etherase
MPFQKTTERESNYNDLETKSIKEIITDINYEDKSVANSVRKSLSEIEKLTLKVYNYLLAGGRLFYIGSGTSGRMGVLDASECPPTFGVNDTVIGIIAGGDKAIRNSQEFAEDSVNQGWLDLKNHNINKKDIVIGIAASGTTPYVLNALKSCNKNQIETGSICCNRNSPISLNSNNPVEVIVGPEYITGSSRMKAGTAQKMILNMISTAVMIKLGKVKGSLMIDMQLSNNKLIERALDMLTKSLNVTKEEAEKLILKYGSVRKVIENHNVKS